MLAPRLASCRPGSRRLRLIARRSRLVPDPLRRRAMLAFRGTARSQPADPIDDAATMDKRREIAEKA